jgi:hypothetical protein
LTGQKERATSAIRRKAAIVEVRRLADNQQETTAQLNRHSNALSRQLARHLFHKQLRELHLNLLALDQKVGNRQKEIGIVTETATEIAIKATSHHDTPRKHLVGLYAHASRLHRTCVLSAH